VRRFNDSGFLPINWPNILVNPFLICLLVPFALGLALFLVIVEVVLGDVAHWVQI
jgi:hypothetical protein